MKTPWHLTVLIILVSAGVAETQVTPTQSGRALDANYLVGGGGLNSIRYNTRRFDTNLYVTGQVAGGFHFRGTQPYAGANQLRLDLPSAGMDDFLRGSVGVQQVTSGMSYGPTRYFSVDRTVLSARDIAGGLNAPGTSIPRAAYLPATSAKRLYDSAINAYKPVVPDVGRQLLYNPLIQPTFVGPSVGGAAGTARQRLDRGAVRPAASTLFGIIHESDQQRLAEELTESQLARRVDTLIREPVEKPVDTRVRGEPKKPDEATTPKPEPDKSADRFKAPAPDQDVFLDMLLAMEKMRADAKEPPAVKIPGTDSSGTDDDDDDVIVPARLTDTTAVRQVQDRIVLVRLAGKNRDLFNLNMSRAEKKLAEGKYYEAAKYYEIADILNRGNPLAPLGATLALFAADEPLSAAYRLRRAMGRFPPLMETRVDVNLILNKSIVEIRIGQLEHRLGESDEAPEPSLVFLAAFIRSSMAQPAKAAKHAETLKKIAARLSSPKSGKEKIYKVYADHLLKAASPSTQPATSKGS